MTDKEKMKNRSDLSAEEADARLVVLHKTPTALPASPRPSTGESSTSQLNVLVVVPGFGNPNHAELLQNNIKWLRTQSVPITCDIYVYAELPLVEAEYAPCKLIRRSGFWTEFLADVSDERLLHIDCVLIWLDDVEVAPDADMQRMLQIMKCNNLDVSSPAFHPDHHTQYEVLACHRPDLFLSVGRYVNFIEYQFTFFHVEAFRCLRKLVRPDVNPRGWGLDMEYPATCASKCMGVMDEVWMRDTSSGSYDRGQAKAEINAYTKLFNCTPALMIHTSGEAMLDPRVSCGTTIRPLN